MQGDRSYRVYVHRRNSDGKIFYVGKGKGNRPYLKSGRSKYWNNIVNKYGYSVEIVLDWTYNECCVTYEKILIHCIGIENLCNHTLGGEGAKGLAHTDESKEKIRKSKKELWKKPEYREAHTGINHHRKGVKTSERVKEIISRTHKGRVFSDIHKKRISDSIKGERNPMYGKALSDCHKEKISLSSSGINHHRYGKELSAEVKLKISNSLTGRKLSDAHKISISMGSSGRKMSRESIKKSSEARKIKDLYKFESDNGHVFNGTRFEFIMFSGCDPSSVTKLIKGILKTTSGWKILR